MGALSKTLAYWKRNGLKAACYAVLEELEKRGEPPYEYDAPAPSVLEAQRLRAGALFSQSRRDDKEKEQIGSRVYPFFTVITPCYNTPESFFFALLESLEDQTWPYWELILADAGDESPLEGPLEEWRRKKRALDPAFSEDRIRYFRLEKNGGISENTNEAIRRAGGDYLVLLDHDDLLTPDALYEMARGIRLGKEENKEYLLLYSDEDKTEEKGEKCFTPHEKQKFNLDLLLSNNYVCHLLALKNQEKQVFLRKKYDGAQDYDLVLRRVADISEQEILHIPRVLYHWRISASSSADNPRAKAYAYEAGKEALKEFLRNFLQPEVIMTLEVKNSPHLGFYQTDYGTELLAARPDIAMVGGPVWEKNRITGGIRVDGRPVYAGLRKGFSGPMHRASLKQDACSLDLRSVRMREEIRDRWSSRPDHSQESFDLFCRELRQEGWHLLYDPGFGMDKEAK